MSYRSFRRHSKERITHPAVLLEAERRLEGNRASHIYKLLILKDFLMYIKGYTLHFK
jgi:hypothetical protein